MSWWTVIIFLAVAHAGVRANNVPANVPESEHPADIHRSGRFFPFYTIGRIANVPCTSPSGLSGTCLIAGECRDNGGLASGSCSTRTNQAVCCVYTQSCGGSTNLNSTYFTNAGYPGPYNGGGTCTFTVTPSSGICQLRIDFRTLSLEQPTGDGACNNDRLTITGGSPAVVPLCGENTGQHVYLNFVGGGAITIRVATNGGVSFNRLWNMELSQIACASAERAPVGCLQYYTETSGEISSFNYGLGANPALTAVGTRGSRQLANTNYGICIRPAGGRCSVTYSLPTTDRYAFTVTGDASAIDPAMVGSGAVGATGALCTTDYIIIPNPTGGGSDRFCGLGIDPVTSASTRPFVLYTVTNGNETPDVANRGFRLVYDQNACAAV
uniref:CUB domain-containing protein n=1 Tax=Anopheles atroparvus TaxID=41427 RepID=A0AAG5D896_ANOAO